jgi:hypothetical protein
MTRYVVKKIVATCVEDKKNGKEVTVEVTGDGVLTLEDSLQKPGESKTFIPVGRHAELTMKAVGESVKRND